MKYKKFLLQINRAMFKKYLTDEELSRLNS
jgi:hypothetical protein